MTEATKLNRDDLKAEAAELGLEYRPNISDKELAALIEGAKEQVSKFTKEDLEDALKHADVAYKELLDPSKKKDLVRDEAQELVRCLITCMNPQKQEYKGELFTAMNAQVSVRKYIPFEAETHVPRIILNMIKDRQFPSFKTVKVADGRGETKQATLVPEFRVMELDALTPAELDRLRQDQKARGF